MLTRRTLAEYLLGRGADYLFTVKGNPPTLHDDIRLRFDHRIAQRAADFIVETAKPEHGRRERRSIWTSSALNDYLNFPGVGQVFAVRREIDEVKSATELRLGIALVCSESHCEPSRYTVPACESSDARRVEQGGEQLVDWRGVVRVLVAAQASIDAGRGAMEALGQTSVAESVTDLVHFTLEAPCLPRTLAGALRPSGETGLRKVPFAKQSFLHSFGESVGADREEQRVAALGPGGVGHLEGGSASRDCIDHFGGEDAALEKGRHLARARAGEVQAGATRLSRRWSDDAAVDVGSPGFDDHSFDFPARRGCDGVGVHIEGFEPRLCDLPRQVQRAVGRAHREHCFAPSEQSPQITGVVKARGLRPFARGAAAALGHPGHFGPRRLRRRPHGCTHLSRVKQSQPHCFFLLHREVAVIIAAALGPISDATRGSSRMRSNTERLAWFNGEMMPESEVRISFRDRGWLYGDTAFDVARTFGGEPFMLREHLERLYRSLRYLQLDPGYDVDEMEEISKQVVEANRPLLEPNGDYWVGQHISRGINAPEGESPQYPGPTIVVDCTPLPLYSRGRGFREGIEVIVPSIRRTPPESLSPRAKLCNYINVVLGDLEVKARNRDAWAVLLDQHGNLAEGTGCNLFLVDDGALRTPREDFVLPGVSRQVVMDLAKELDIECREDDLSLYDAYNADEVFLTSTSLCLCPVRSVNAVEVGGKEGIPGPVTRRLTDAYKDLAGHDFVAQVLSFENAGASAG